MTELSDWFKATKHSFYRRLGIRSPERTVRPRVDPTEFTVDNPLYFGSPPERPPSPLIDGTLLAATPSESRRGRSRRTGAQRRKAMRASSSSGLHPLLLESLKVLRDVVDEHHLGRVDGLRTILESSASLRGSRQSLLDAKKISANFRRQWILHGGDEGAAQVSYLGRSLPRGDAILMDATLADHRRDLQSVSVTDRDTLSKMKEFAIRWSRRFCPPSSKAAQPDLPSLSACTERTVRQGGQLGFVTSLGLHQDSDSFVANQVADLPPQDGVSLLWDASLVLHSLEPSASDLSVAVALPERGFKVRVITKSPARYQILGHIARKRLLLGLRKDPSSKSTLVGVNDADLLSSLSGVRECVVSTDLKKATDLLPHDLVSALVDGLEASGRFLDLEVRSLRQLTAPQRVSWNGEEGVTSRGILMGLPTTWAILSLVHLFWWSEAVRSAAAARRCSLRTAFFQNTFAICGDDALFVGWRDVAESYANLVSKCGGQFSEGKHYVCVSPPLRGVFIERLYEFHSDGFATRCSAVPLKALVAPDPPSTLGIGGLLKTSEALRMFTSIDQILSSNPSAEWRIRSFLRRRPMFYGIADSLSLRSGVPLSLGGSGLPRRARDDPGSLERARIYRDETGKSFPSRLRAEVDETWALAAQVVESDFAGFLEAGEFVLAPEAPEVVEGRLCVDAGTLEEFRASAEASAYRDLVLVLGVPDRRNLPFLRLRKVGETARVWWREVDGYEPHRVPNRLFIRRTRAPRSGTLLYPRWVGSTRASEALVRSLILHDIGVQRPGPL